MHYKAPYSNTFKLSAPPFILPNACTRVKHIHQRTCTSEMNYLCNNKIIVCTRDCRMKQQHTSSGMHIHAYVIDTILAKIYKSMTEMTVEK